MTSPKVVAVIGATGAVGRRMVEILESRAFPVKELRLYASPRSAGTEISFRGNPIRVRALEPSSDFSGVEIALFSAGSSVSKEYAPRATASGAWVIDNASLFRMDADVPLVVPEINAAEAKRAPRRIVANPNCTTAQMVMALKPLHDAFGLRRVILSSYQAVSGKGQKGVDEFIKQADDVLAGHAAEPKEFPHAIAFNCIPHIDVFDAEGVTGEERKVMNETRKILGLPELKVSATCVRVPVVNGHSESVLAEFDRPVDLAKARAALESMPGVKLVDEPGKNRYPLATEASGHDAVLVGRLRKDPGSNGLQFWVVADNLRKGAALNAVQIAEILF